MFTHFSYLISYHLLVTHREWLVWIEDDRRKGGNQFNFYLLLMWYIFLFFYSLVEIQFVDSSFPVIIFYFVWFITHISLVIKFQRNIRDPDGFPIKNAHFVVVMAKKVNFHSKKEKKKTKCPNHKFVVVILQSCSTTINKFKHVLNDRNFHLYQLRFWFNKWTFPVATAFWCVLILSLILFSISIQLNHTLSM